MKLIFCPDCQDIRKLLHEQTYCSCGKSWGQYTDDINAVIGGLAIPIGIANYSFVEALKADRVYGQKDGTQFTAFIIPLPCKTVQQA